MLKRVVTVCIILSISACSVGGAITQEIHQPSLGQELIDLQRAADSGAISTEEYQKLKRDIITADNN